MSFKIIYVYRNEANEGLKVGEHSFSPYKDIHKFTKQELVAEVEGRVNDQHRTANVSYEIVHAEIAQDPSGLTFSDGAVRDKIKRMGGEIIPRNESKHGAQEWTTAPLDLVKRAIKSLRDGVEYPTQSTGSASFEPREEQEACARKIRDARLAGHKDFLVAAKPRFGKTATILYAIDLCNQSSESNPAIQPIKRVAIVTHRPVVNDSWAKEIEWILGDSFRYESRESLEGVSTHELFSSSPDDNFLRFLSLQDLRGRETLSGEYKERTQKFLDTEYDLLIIDEGQEGIDTELAKDVLEKVKHNFKIIASGTAYKLLAHPDSPYTDETQFIWEYVDEQKAKEKWYKDHPNEANPYANMPSMIIHTLDISKSIPIKPADDQWFTLAEFWEVSNNKFVHEAEIGAFLDGLFREEEMPYGKLYEPHTRHSLWVMPSENAARLIAEKLRIHSNFSSYDVVKVSGDSEGTKDPLAKVRKTISKKPWETKSITVTVGRLTVGTTVPGWGAVLMFAEGSSANNYIQTGFRAQSPCENLYGNNLRKTEAHIFDFAPDRTLQVMVELAKAGTQNPSEAQARLAELSYYMPILMSDGVTTSPLHSDRILEEINTVFIQRANDRGLDAGSPIFNMNAITRENDNELFAEIENVTANKKSSTSSKTNVAVSNQGLKKPGSKTSGTRDPGNAPKPPKQSEKEQKTREEKAKRELAKISIALPRLVLGAAVELSSKSVQELQLEKFPELFTDEDWKAFMGDVNKDLFLRSLKYFNEDVLRGTLKFLLQQVEEAMTLPPLERSEKILDVLSKIKNPDKEVVFTPHNVAELVFDNTNISFPEGNPPTFYDSNIKSGIFPLLAAKKITEQYDIDFSTACQYIYGNAPTLAAKYTTLKILGIKRTDPLADNISVLNPSELKDFFGKLTKKKDLQSLQNTSQAVACAMLILNKGRTHSLGKDSQYKEAIEYYDKQKWSELYEFCCTIEEEEEMKFDYLIGNPPYTFFVGHATGKQVYLDFLIQGALMADNVGMVFLSSWHNNKPLDKTRKLMKSMAIDKRVKSLRSFDSSSSLFPTISDQGIDIIAVGPNQVDGATNYFRNYDDNHYATADLFSKTTGFVLKDVLQDKIVKKVISHKDFIKVTPADWLHQIQAEVKTHSPNDKASTDDFLALLQEKKDKKHTIRVGMPKGGKIDWLYGSDEVFKTHVPEGKYAVVFAHASDHTNGITNDRQLICTEYETVKSTMALVFDTSEEAYRFWRYSRTSFFAYLMESRLTSHNTYPQAYAHVPVVDLSNISFIDWGKDIKEINSQLCKYYKLTKEEQEVMNEFGYVFSHPMNEYNRQKFIASGVILHDEDQKR